MKSNNKTLQGLKKVNDRLLGIETFLLALITILLVAAIFIEVVCRYFLFISAAWAEEFTRYLFIWLTYIGSATLSATTATPRSMCSSRCL